MFTHLHVHSEYSLLDGLCKIPELLNQADKLNQKAIALTDHGVLYGAIQFYKEAVQRNIKPIIGIEAYLSSNSRHSKEVKDKQRQKNAEKEAEVKEKKEAVSKAKAEAVPMPRLPHQVWVDTQFAYTRALDGHQPRTVTMRNRDSDKPTRTENEDENKTDRYRKLLEEKQKKEQEAACEKRDAPKKK